VSVEQRNLITLEEIAGIQLECGECHAKIIVPISDKRPLADKCRHCSEPWLVDGRSDLHQRFLDAISNLRHAMTELTDGSNKGNCTFSLEMKPALRERNEPQ